MSLSVPLHYPSAFLPFLSADPLIDVIFLSVAALSAADLSLVFKYVVCFFPLAQAEANQLQEI